MYDEFEDRKPEGGWNKHDRHDHTPEQIQWLVDHGCQYHKVTAEPGDLLLWDSVSASFVIDTEIMLIQQRTVHYGATPSSDNPRIASCELEDK